jgi:hypothetical protein
MIRFTRPVLAAAVALFSSVAAAASFPTGTFTAGQATFRFDADGRFHVAAGQDGTVDGTYKTSGDEITLTDVSGNMACAKENAIGRYKWSYAADAITFTKIKDDCDDRSGDVTAQPWKKQ